MIDNQYFYAHPSDIGAESLILRGDEARHAHQVLRKRAGDRFFVTDGTGREFTVTVTSSQSSKMVCTIDSTAIRPRELGFPLRLVLAILKREAMEWALEKAVELGISTFTPVLAQRSVAIGGGKAVRWKGIALSAMKQSRRSFLPAIEEPQTLASFMESVDTTNGLFLVADESAAESIMAIHHTPKLAVTLLIGPEGGLTDDELQKAVGQGFRPVTLGKRRLRAETAVVAALSRFSTTE